MEELDPLDAELFEKTLSLLKDLPEAGVILQIERNLPRLIRNVFGEHGDLFKKADMEQWQKAEARLRDALNEFARAARSTYQGRLFAQDALQGLRVIDITREKFDAILMNPPFGALSKGSRSALEIGYPNSSNDLLGIFVDRGLTLLRKGGRLGAITSRTCFFLSSFKDWRKKVVLDRSGIEVIADLGQGVMDDAMVEAAAYVLVRSEPKPHTNVIRAIADTNRKLAIEESVLAFRTASKDERLFLSDEKSFDLLPGSPFVYWANPDTLRTFIQHQNFEDVIGSVCQGLSTSDNFRFVRSIWEVEYKDTIFCYFPADGSNFCDFDDPFVQEFLNRRHFGSMKWAFHVMAGASWIQTSSATVDLKAAISSAMASAGVLQPSVFLGRLFIRAAMSLSQVWLTSLRSVPFGMNWRSKPLVFSFEPRCQGACGSQNQMSIFSRRASSGWQAISEPRS
jgi:hypothetical protein